MIWLTWRQFRAQALVAVGALAAFAAALAVTGPRLAHSYSTGLAGCTTLGDCSRFTQRFFADHQPLFLALSSVVLFLPALIGLFWGAPLVSRELEAGTHRLAWTQTVTRTRWLAVKLTLVGLAAMALAGLTTLAVSWWASPLDRISGGRIPRLTPPLFETRGIVPIGYAAFAFALGVTVGIVMRRTVAAMAVALVAFIAVQIAVPLWVREHLMPPTHAITAVTADNIDGFELHQDSLVVSVDAPDPQGWLLSNRTIDAAGNVVASLPAEVAAACVPSPPTAQEITERKEAPGVKQQCFAAISRLGYRQDVVYQPGSRFWPLQWIETGLFGAVALALTAVCFRRIRRVS